MTSVLVYDDDCGFCTWSAEFLADHDGFELVGFSDLNDETIDRLPDGWRRCAHFVTDEAVYSCGEAMDEAFARTTLVPSGLVRALRNVPGYVFLREAIYRLIANNRPLASRVVRR